MTSSSPPPDAAAVARAIRTLLRAIRGGDLDATEEQVVRLEGAYVALAGLATGIEIDPTDIYGEES